jgi:hypothetical protein
VAGSVACPARLACNDRVFAEFDERPAAGAAHAYLSVSEPGDARPVHDLTVSSLRLNLASSSFCSFERGLSNEADAQIMIDRVLREADGNSEDKLIKS